MRKLNKILLIGGLVLGFTPLAVASLTSMAKAPVQVKAAEREDFDIPDVISGNSLNMRVEGGMLKWDAVDGATGYKVYLKKGTFTVGTFDVVNEVMPISQIDQTKADSGQYFLEVAAVGVSKSALMQYYYTSNVDKLESPTGLQWLGNNAVWEYNTDPEVLGYTLTLYDFNGVVATINNATAPTDLTEYNPQDGWTFKVQAKGNNTLSAKRSSNIVESPARGSRTRTLPSVDSGNTLNMKISNGVMSWDAVDGATGYKIYVKQNSNTIAVFDTTNPFYPLSTDMDSLKIDSGEYSIEVGAKGVSKTDSMLWFYTSHVDKLEAPHGAQWIGYKAAWESVEGASSYDVSLYNLSGLVVTIPTTECLYDFEGNLPQDGWTFKVKANTNGTFNAKRNSALTESPAFVSQKHNIGVIIVDSTNDVQNQGGQVYLETDKGITDWTTEGGFSRQATYGSTATLKAKPDSGYQFLGWRLDGEWVSSELEYTFTVHDGGTYYAMFQKVDFYFVMQPTNQTVGVGNAVNIVWTTNYVPDSTEIQNWDENAQEWDQWDVNHPTNKQDDYDFQNDVVGAIRFRLVATSAAYGTAISDEFTVTWVEPNITLIDATIAEPVGGEHPSFELNLNTETCTYSYLSWYDGSTKMTSSDTFVTGKNYQLRFILNTNSGYQFTNETIFKVNGVQNVEGPNQYGFKSYYFTAKAPAVTEYDVIYSPGEGQGSTDLNQVVAGTTIALVDPQTLNFSPVQGMMFDAWSINDTRYEIGDEYVINSDTLIIALWKNVPVTATSLTAAYSGGDINVGDKLDTSKISITVNYSNGTNQAVAIKDAEFYLGANKIPDIKNYQFNNAGINQITIKYLGLEATINVTVIDPVAPKTLTGIEVTGTYKTEYTVGETFSTEGIVVKAVYSNGDKEDVPLNEVTFSGYNMNQAGNQTVTATWNELSTTFQILVKEAPVDPEKTLVSISLSGTQQTEFTVGDSFSAEGLVVTAHYSDDSSESIALNNVEISGYNMNQEGKQTITVSYQGKTATYEITVKAKDTPVTPDDPVTPNKSSGLPAGAVVGIVIGSALVVGVGGFALVWFVIKKKTWADFLALFKKK